MVYDVALVSFRHTPSQVKVSRLPVRINGHQAHPEAARGIRITRGQQTDLIVYGGTGDTPVICNNLRFKGRLCVFSLQGEKPCYVAVVDGGELSYRGKVLVTSSTAGVTERPL